MIIHKNGFGYATGIRTDYIMQSISTFSFTNVVDKLSHIYTYTQTFHWFDVCFFFIIIM